MDTCAEEKSRKGLQPWWSKQKWTDLLKCRYSVMERWVRVRWGGTCLEFLRLPANLTPVFIWDIFRRAIWVVSWSSLGESSAPQKGVGSDSASRPSCCWRLYESAGIFNLSAIPSWLEATTVSWTAPALCGGGVQVMMTLLLSNIKNRSRLLLRRKQCSPLFVCMRPNRTLVLTHIVYVSKLAFLQY